MEIPADVRLLLDELAVCTDKDSPYLFPFLSGKKTGEAAYAEYNGALLRFNRDLRSLAETCGVGEPVTSYTIRHSFATGRTDRDDQRAVGAYVYQDHANLLEELFLGTSVGGEPGLLRERV